jgi:TetR/AcrR family transcriptional regulator, transcriptional repressor for nem operon
MTQAESHHESKVKLLDAALHVIRAKGYSATRIEDICDAAGLTKGSFFHHFKSKEDLALAAADHFAQMADRRFAAAPYQQAADPLDRLLGYVDFRAAILQGELPDVTCLLGTMVQEAYDTNPAIRSVCEKHIGAHAAAVARDIADAKQRYAPDAPWTPESLGLFTQAVLQGAFVLAKAKGGPEIATECLSHLRRYLVAQFRQRPRRPVEFFRADRGQSKTRRKKAIPRTNKQR